MKIRSAEIIPLSIPFTDGSRGTGLMPSKWTHLDVALLKLTTEDGITGWGDGFAYHCRRATIAVLEDMVLPHVVGAEIDDIPAFNRMLQQRLHLHGRYGITIFAISAVDIALWDIAAKERGVPLAALLSETPKKSIPAYASLVRYGDPAQVADYVRDTVAKGYGTVKLHEIALDCIEAGAAAAGEGVRVTTDVNCNWSLDEAHRMMPEMKRLGLYWVEEPVFPPDDADTLHDLQQTYGVSIASGENACTLTEFRRTIPKIDFVQPSVIKTGGVTEMAAILDAVAEAGRTAMPHSPYFGPGYWATAQVMAAKPAAGLFEYFWIRPEAFIDPSIPLPESGEILLPQGPGLGFEPDPDVLAKYRID
ncbi:MAG: mandelate racemase/muconate lactonizing enzyme family protein [Minwuia sp.]|uniref:mandelate racemase/muconate lactonizing enzyme family protein n=1 Tax=Minwuia sp. TaxID=2493630 RepID=UPI003A862EDF